MTATFWTASAVTFTNGQKTATVTSGSPFNSSQSYANWKLSSGNKNEPVEVKSASGTQIELFENWTGPSGSTTVTMEPSPASAAAAGAAAQALITQIQTLVNSASVTATANSFVKRDSGGRTKTATPLASDDAVNKGYLGTAAQRNVGTSAGELMEVGFNGVGGVTPTYSDWNAIPLNFGGFLTIGIGAQNKPNNLPDTFYTLVYAGQNTDVVLALNTTQNGLHKLRRTSEGNWIYDGELYHSGNTNFNEFGGNAGEIILKDGITNTANSVLFYINTFAAAKFNSLSVVGGGSSIPSSFDIVDKRTGAVLGSPSSFDFLGSTSNKCVFIRANGLAGLTVDRPVRLQVKAGYSALIFNP